MKGIGFADSVLSYIADVKDGKGWSVKELSEKSGLCRRKVNRIYNEGQLPKIADAYILLKTLGRTFADVEKHINQKEN